MDKLIACLHLRNVDRSDAAACVVNRANFAVCTLWHLDVLLSHQLTVPLISSRSTPVPWVCLWLDESQPCSGNGGNERALMNASMVCRTCTCLDCVVHFERKGFSALHVI